MQNLLSILKEYLSLPAFRLIVGLAIYCAAYALLNYRLFVIRVLYRWAAHDIHSAIVNALSFGLQAGLLLVLVVFVRRLWWVLLLFVLAISGAVNTIHSGILGGILDLANMSWMLGEYRQLPSAFWEFWPVFIISFVRIGLVVWLLCLARMFLRPVAVSWILLGRYRKIAVFPIALMLLIFDVSYLGGMSGRAAEVNAFVMAAESLAQSFPDRQAVNMKVKRTGAVDKIVWLVDESVSWRYFESVMQPSLSKKFQGIDYGEATSFSNCSAQSNAALRWGVDVATVNPKTDLRTTPSIWGFARATGYTTVLIDGQVVGAPQNLIWPPELRLIDSVIPAGGGIYTDGRLASLVNSMLKSDGKYFIYVVFRGAHYQYQGNYPANAVPADSSIELKYRRAIEFSKQGVFEKMFDGVDRSAVAVFYTSDHGQILKDGIIPHCNEVPYSEEFSVPLIVFAPDSMREQLLEGSAGVRKHSHSQIFSTSLIFMGYSYGDVVAGYDNPLPLSSKRIIVFGKAIFPSAPGALIDVREKK